MSEFDLGTIHKWIVKSPPGEWLVKKVRDLLTGALRQGPIPKHVAFVMDGNRRYARNNRMETIEGHNQGFQALSRVLEVCYKCGVEVVTVFAFSVDNFTRPAYEVDGLMAMAKIKLQELVAQGELLDRYGAQIRVLGERQLIRKDVLACVDDAIERTKHNTKAKLNICFPYASTEEMSSAIRSTVGDYLMPAQRRSGRFSQARIVRQIKSLHGGTMRPMPTIIDDPHNENTRSDGEDGGSSSATLPPDSPRVEADPEVSDVMQDPDSITAETIDNHMYTAGDPPVDILVRTSGVERLSNFLCWQCHEDTHVFFLDCMWPDFDLQHFIFVLLEWQWRQKQAERDERPPRRKRNNTASVVAR